MGEPQASRPRFQNLEHLIAGMTLAIGLAAGIAVGLFHDRVWGAGVAIGAGLAWLNFRWLKQGVGALAASATAQSSTGQTVHVPIGSYFVAMFRYALIGIAVYVIFKYLGVPILSMIAGLFALGAATIVAGLYEILRPVN